MKGKEFCPTCGLEYRQWAIKINKLICDECEPSAFSDLHKENLTSMKRRTVGQEHITEHTWFPKNGEIPNHLKVKNWKHRREVR